MASNPPFHVEDSTDEDFFDKLVDDDLDFKVPTTSSKTVGTFSSDQNEFDEAKAFANLSINELDNIADDLSTDVVKLQPISKSEDVEDIGNTLGMPPNPTEQPESEDAGAEALSDKTFTSKSSGESFSDTTVVSKSSGELGPPPGVKEVGWSAFHADPAGNDGSGFGSYSDFFSELGGGEITAGAGTLNNGAHASVGNEHVTENSNVFGQYNNNGAHVSVGNEHVTENSNIFGQYNTDQSSDVQDLNSSEYWENQYPGWKYDSSIGQWYQVEGFDAGLQENADSSLSSALGMGNEQQAEVSYLQQQTAQSVDVAVSEIGRTENVSNWNQASPASDTTENTTDWNRVSQVSSYWNQGSQDNNGYPAHMVFDAQYPGWYYDTITQKWESLESYTASVQSSAQVQSTAQVQSSAQVQDRGGYAPNDHMGYNMHGQVTGYNDQGFGSKAQEQKWAGPVSNYGSQSSSVSQQQPMEDHRGQNISASGHVNRQDTFNTGFTSPYYENVSQSQNDFSVPSSSQGFIGGSLSQQQFNDTPTNRNDHKYGSNNYYGNQNLSGFSQQNFQSSQMSYAPAAAGRSSAGRPAHALVTFGFGGKLVVLKDNSGAESFNVGRQSPVGGSISVLSLAQVVNHKADASSHGMGVRNYFQALLRQCVPGPLSGGSVGSKELNKWIDERIANPESADMDYGKAEVLKLLLSLLKIACLYYGKLRSPYGTDAALKESDSPESAVARLFASAKINSSHFGQHGAVVQCLQQMPPEGQMRVTAAEVQSLLVSGRKREALECAQEGQMWGPALVLAAQLGNQFYVETVKKMALSQFVVGSPLRTLCLLIAGQPAEVFSAGTTTIGSMGDAKNMHQQQAQFGANGMLDSWEENLAVITANRTKDDELVLMHLGDCLWKDRSDINAAHICYLVAEANFEPYSDTARMCLVGADHWKFPRTYASPEAIQMTEVYEYSKTLGNSQFVLLPFQPYKLVYAQMLAEVGKMSDALKYCQAVLKSLKTGRAPEVETLRNLVSSFEERIKAHQQGGFSTNLAPKRLVGKLLNLFDNTAHRVVGGIPPPVPTSGGTQGHENFQPLGPRGSTNQSTMATSQSTMAMSSLVPSQSTGPTNEWGAAESNRTSMHTRSISEPDFGRSPRQGHADTLKEGSATGMQEKASAGGGTSRFGRFGFGSQLFQKTVGLVLKPRQDRQAKLGDSNKFYYDEKLKRWVEEGAEPPAQEAALPPPPPTSVFQNGTSDNYNLKSAMQSQASYSSGGPEYKSPSVVDNNPGIPPLPPTTSNQYSARGRMGVRSRYVDTFNKGGGTPTNSFQSPSIPSPVKPSDGPKRSFFVPAPVSAAEQQATNDAYVNNTQETFTFENPPASPSTDSFQSMQKFASSSNIYQGTTDKNGSFPVQSRRTLSWSGNFNENLSAQPGPELKPLGEVMGMHPSSSDPSLVRSGDDLHEVEL